MFATYFRLEAVFLGWKQQFILGLQFILVFLAVPPVAGCRLWLALFRDAMEMRICTIVAHNNMDCGNRAVKDNGGRGWLRFGPNVCNLF